jgi:hypothetical protein
MRPPLEPVELDGFKLDVGHYLFKDYSDIGEAASELPPVIEWVNMKLQSLTEAKIVKKQEIEEAEAEAYFSLRSGGFEETFSGKSTETALGMAVSLDKKVMETHRDYAVLTGWVLRLANLQESLKAKLDLVRSTEATRRSLVGNEITEE